MVVLSSEAVGLLDLGFPLVPLYPNSKRPMWRNWQRSCGTHDRGILAQYEYLGVVCGQRMPDGRYLAVVDADDMEGLLSLQERGYPETAFMATGQGMHLWYGTTEPVPTVTLEDGLEIKGKLAQVAVVTPDRPRHWQQGCAPWEIDIADAPAWVYTKPAVREPVKGWRRPGLSIDHWLATLAVVDRPRFGGHVDVKQLLLVLQ